MGWSRIVEGALRHPVPPWRHMEWAWRVMRIRELWGHPVRDLDGRELGAVVASVHRPDGGIDLLVQERLSRRRVYRLDIDDVELDDGGILWRRPLTRVVRVVVRRAEEVAG